ncbi:hypothetical protein NN3_52460 [Nocardia neocaledoniensis NBRC 108232]|uniref:Putative restriction endonuclease n=1 Tax=Nocardia neocaledoniensis TaxID=236511 RepID=A0A317NI05_9NOCA|nr:Uma2 family endonuclease [Nocardia neocaledoniensis]PWV74941.1 putative restriction endonuclease [Nocardia neocaledoniensis]GEM34239.1 hypothetical protein NN3_52460 [Nocardia neocaledoniensis NBRC 108232]
MCLVLVFDAAFSVVLLGFTQIGFQIFEDPAGGPPSPYRSFVVAGVWGLTAPVMLRAKLPNNLGKHIGGMRPFGAIRKLQEQPEREVDDICTGEETTWLSEKIVELEVISVPDLAEWTERYLVRRSGHTESSKQMRQKRIRHIHEVLKDLDSPDSIRRRTIVQGLLDDAGHRAVRQLFRYAAKVAPPKIVVRRSLLVRMGRKLDVRGNRAEKYLLADILLPPGIIVDAHDSRLHIGNQSREIDDQMRGLAVALRRELKDRGVVEGMHHGWITIRPTLRRRRGIAIRKFASHFATLLRECPQFGQIIVHADGVIANGELEFATSALLASPPGSPRQGSEEFGDAFQGSGVWLAADFCSKDDLVNGRNYKRHFYAAAGVPLYFLIDLQGKTITTFRDPDCGCYASEDEIAFGDMLCLPPPANVKLETVGFMKLAK